MNTLKSNLKQLGLLTWKNYTIQKRSIIGLLLEILLPALFSIILLPIRSIVKSVDYPNVTNYSTFDINTMPYLNKPLMANQWYIGYNTLSNNLLAKQIMSQVVNKLNNSSFYLKEFSTENEMASFNNLLIKLENNSNITAARLAGISFLELTNKKLTYKIRLSYSSKNQSIQGSNLWKTNQLYPSSPTKGPREKQDIHGGEPGYYREAFLTLQNAIDTIYLNSQTNRSDFLNEINLKRFPYPPYSDDSFTFLIQTIFPFILMISFVFTVILTSKAIVTEKELGLKEAMKLMGMKPWIYWLSWYIKTFVLLLPAVVFITIAFKVKIPLKDGGMAAILDKSDTFILFIFFLLYISSSITFTLLITSLFKKGNSAAAASGIIWFLTYLPFVFIQLRYDDTSFSLKILAAFVNNLGK